MNYNFFHYTQVLKRKKPLYKGAFLYLRRKLFNYLPIIAAATAGDRPGTGAPAAAAASIAPM